MRNILTPYVLALLLLIGAPLPSGAEVIIHLEPHPPTTTPDTPELAHGSIDVYLSVTEGSISLASYSITINAIPTTSTFAFTGELIPIPDQPNFPGQSLSAFSPPGPTLQAADLLLTTPDALIATQIGLFRAGYQIQTTDPSTISLRIEPATTRLFDGTVNEVLVNQLLGTTIHPIPEPTSLLLLWVISSMTISTMQRRISCTRSSKRRV